MCNQCKENEFELLPEIEALLHNNSKHSGISYESNVLEPPPGKVKYVSNEKPIYFVNIQGNRRVSNDSGSLPPMVKCGDKFVFDRFVLGEYALRFHHYRSLMRVQGVIQAFAGQPDIVIIIEGHADRTGNEVGNAGLSLNRGYEVLRFLKELSGGRLPIGSVIIGFGSSVPLPRANAAGNRRVEIKFCKITPRPKPLPIA